MAKTVTLSAADLAPKRAPASSTRQRGVSASTETVPLQFRMPAEFVREFKQAALDRDLKLNKFLELIFSEHQGRG